MSGVLAELFATGQIALVAIIILVAEMAVLLFWVRPAKGRALIVFNALSGISLMLALYAALRNDPWWVVALFMGGGFATHLGDLIARLRSGER